MLNAVSHDENYEPGNQTTPENNPDKSQLDGAEISRHSIAPKNETASEVKAKEAPSVVLSINDNGLATLSLGKAGEHVVTFSEARLESLNRTLDIIEEQIAAGEITSLVITSPSKKTFCAGADIKEFARVEGAEMAQDVSVKGQELFARIRNLPVTTVAAVEGATMGGGFELCLNCDYIVAANTPETKMALPEFQLGILPAWSGNTLLPHKIGLKDSLKVMTSTRPLDAKYAHKLGVVDHVTTAEELHETAAAIASGELRPAQHPKSFMKRLQDSFLTYTSIGRSIVKGEALKTMQKEAGEKFLSPYKILDVALESAAYGIAAGLKKEASEFGQLFASPQREELVKLYLTMDEAKRNNSVARSERLKGQTFGINSVAVVGAGGLMGRGISNVMARSLSGVYVTDMSQEAVAATLKEIQDKTSASSSLKDAEKAAIKQQVSAFKSSADLAGTPPDAVLEAIKEDPKIKVMVFKDFQEKYPDAILMTNTSSLSVTEMQKELTNPEKLIGVHFFNPAEKMPLVEIVMGEQTSQDTLDKTIEYVKQLGKVPVVIQKECPGFVVNRLLFTAFDEFGRMMQEGQEIENIDRGAEMIGFQMGGGKTLDLVGLRLAQSVGITLGTAYQSDNTEKMSEGFQKLMEMDRFGQNEGGGFYNYDEKGKAKPWDVLADLGIEKAEKVDIRENGLRYTARLSIEAVKVAVEGIASLKDVELAMQLGAGMIPLGPYRFIEKTGTEEFIKLCDRLADEHGQRFVLSDEQKTFIRNINSQSTK